MLPSPEPCPHCGKPPRPLSPAQTKVYELRWAGHSQTQVADILGVNFRTIQHHSAAIRYKGWKLPVQYHGQDRYFVFLELLNTGHSPAEIMNQMDIRKRQIGDYMTRYRRENGIPDLFQRIPPSLVKTWVDQHLKQGLSLTDIAALHNTTKGRVGGAIHRYKRKQNATSEIDNRGSRPSRQRHRL